MRPATTAAPCARVLLSKTKRRAWAFVGIVYREPGEARRES